jgi:hypothetical protein
MDPNDPKMQPMFLPEVENNSQPGGRGDMIRLMRDSGKEYPQIWHLFAFRPQATDHLGGFTQEIMRGACPLSSGMRELIAALTSSGNRCPF